MYAKEDVYLIVMGKNMGIRKKDAIKTVPRAAINP